MLAVVKRELTDLFYILLVWTLFGLAGIVWFWSIDGDLDGKSRVSVQVQQSNTDSKGNALPRSFRPTIY